MKGYILAEVEVTDPELYETYRPLAAAAIAAHGGRYLVRGGAAEALEGAAELPRMVVLEFDSPEQARAFHGSEEYRPARAIRARAARSRLVLLTGHPPE
jgi:uncharacterized protein (DUF1330 family)